MLLPVGDREGMSTMISVPHPHCDTGDMRLSKSLLNGTLLCLLLSASGSMALPAQNPRDTAVASTEDDRIVDQVRARLAGDVDVKGGNLEVISKDGTVVIKGRVETEAAKAKAGKLAKKVKGVKSVDNQLAVGPPQ